LSVFLNLPGISGALSFGMFLVLATWFALVFIKPFLRIFVRRQVAANEVVGQTLSIFALLYGLLLGLLSISTYQSALLAEDEVVIEATSLAALHRNAETYDEPFRGAARKIILSYAQYLATDAWKEQREGKLPVRGDQLMRQLFETIHGFVPTVESQRTIHADTIKLFDQIRHARLKRLAALIVGIPDVMWTLVWIGATITMMLVLLLDIRLMLHLLLSGAVAFYLGIMIFLLYALENPFRSDVGVSSDIFQTTVAIIEGRWPTQ
jgi:hypothetical protein